MTRRLSLFVVTLLWSATALAHPLAPALLQLQASAPGDYQVLWRISTQAASAIGVAPELPADCAPQTPLRSSVEAGALTTRWSVRCTPPDLTGLRFGASGLAGSGVNVIVTLQPWQRPLEQALLGALHPDFTVAGPASAASVFRDYLQLGIGHLLGGFDHLLFVTGLVLLVRRPRALLATVTAFTAGHSVTLCLAALGVVHVNQAVTELGIAISILLLAGEIARPADAPRTVWSRWPWRMAAAFGLLHGLGFAGALADIGLPPGQIPLALLAFNVGIEVGQIAVVTSLLLLGWSVMGLRRAMRLETSPAMAPLRLLPAYAIGAAAAYWCCDRAARLFSA